MSSNDIRIAGQKETDVFDEEPKVIAQPHPHLQQQPIPPSSGMVKFIESPSASPEATNENPDSRISNDPVTHAVVSSTKAERVHDSLADIYLTGIATFVTNYIKQTYNCFRIYFLFAFTTWLIASSGGCMHSVGRSSPPSVRSLLL